MTNAKRRVAVGALALVLFAGACKREAADQGAATDTAGQASVGRADSMGMGAMGMGSMQMGSDMMAHMQRMSGDSAMSMMTEHGRMLDDMMAQMNSEMQSANVNADSSWTALVDSLRNDMAQMPRMSAAEMQSFMLKHRARVMSLMNMHRTMMDGVAR